MNFMPILNISHPLSTLATLQLQSNLMAKQKQEKISPKITTKIFQTVHYFTQAHKGRKLVH
jgi:hypothetical protein